MSDASTTTDLALTLVDHHIRNGQLPDNWAIQIQAWANTTDQPHTSLIALTALALTQWANALEAHMGTQGATNHIDTLHTRLNFALITNGLATLDD